MQRNNVLVIVAHSDDETLGMGGTIKKYVNQGDKVFVVSMTDGVSSRKTSSDKKIKERKSSANIASECLGFSWVDSADFPDNSMDSIPLLDVIKFLEEVKEKIQPNIVYTHSVADLNVDHRVVTNATLTAFRPQPNETCSEICLFEVPSATDFGHKSITGQFSPNLFIGIADTWDAKLSALNAYSREMRPYPHSRSMESILNLAKLRGNQVGLSMAEAFQVIRKIEH